MDFSENPSCRNANSDNSKEVIVYAFCSLFAFVLLNLMLFTVPFFIAEQIYNGCSGIVSDQKEQHQIMQVKRCRRTCILTFEVHRDCRFTLASL